MKKVLLTSAVALALLGGCNNDYEGADIAGTKLVVSASIDQVKTRVSDTEWNIGDAIGVSDNLSTNPNLNIKFETSSIMGDFTSTTGIYILGSEAVTYTAYYPYSGVEGTSAEEVNFSIVDESGKYVGSSAIDFMFATGATASRENPKVSFTFKHMMSKLKLDFKDSGAGNTKAETPISYTLRGVITDGTFNTEDGTVTPGTTKGTVTVDATLGTASSVILPPLSSAGGGNQEEIQLIITVGDKIYTGTFTPALNASQEYQYSVDLSKTESGEKLQIDSPTIEGWTPNEGGNIGVEEDINLNPTLEVGDFFCNDGITIDKDYDLEQLEADVKSSIVGVVFYVGAATDDIALKREHPSYVHGLVVALNNGSETARIGYLKLSFSTWLDSQSFASDYLSLSVTTGDKSQIQGYNNTKVIELSSKDTSLASGEDTWARVSDGMIPILTDYRTSVPVSTALCTDWYLPSWGELDIIRQNYTDVNSSITKAGGTLPVYNDYTKAVASEKFYWSSTERGSQYMWVSPLVETSEELFLGRTSSGTKGYFRFVLAF